MFLLLLLASFSLSLVLTNQTTLNLKEDDICKEVNGTVWTCKVISECLTVSEESTSFEWCKENDDDTPICCEPNIKRPLPLLNKAKEMCGILASSVYVKAENFSKMEHSLANNTCFERMKNNSITPVGNKAHAEPLEYPRMALVGFGQLNDGILWKCGGSLISDRYVLGSAVCSNKYYGDPGWVRLGEYNLSSHHDEEVGESNSTLFEIIERIPHPDFVDIVVYNDIVLYKLNSTVEFNAFIRPVCLHTQYQMPDGEATVAGWGYIDDEYGKTSEVLLKENMIVISKEVCASKYEPDGDAIRRGIKDESMFCARTASTGGGTCKRVRGGPLQIRFNCTYVQVGIISFGGFICSGSKPEVYTRVSHFIPWIESVVWPLQ